MAADAPYARTGCWSPIVPRAHCGHDRVTIDPAVKPLGVLPTINDFFRKWLTGWATALACTWAGGGRHSISTSLTVRGEGSEFW